MEHIIANQISPFLIANNVLTPCQHGFEQILPATAQLLYTIREFASVLDMVMPNGVIFHDCTKALHLVSH